MFLLVELWSFIAFVGGCVLGGVPLKVHKIIGGAGGCDNWEWFSV